MHDSGPLRYVTPTDAISLLSNNVTTLLESSPPRAEVPSACVDLNTLWANSRVPQPFGIGVSTSQNYADVKDTADHRLVG